MTIEQSKRLAQQAEEIYLRNLKTQLQRSHLHQFVAIEPISGDYFLGSTLSEAIGAARTAHPDRLAHALRVGHLAAVHIGRLGI